MVSKEYAKALYDLLSEDEKRQSIDWFYVIDEIIQTQPDYVKLMHSPNVTDEVKKELLHTAFQEAPNAYLHFLYVLIDQDRFHILPEISKEFVSLMNEQDGIMVVQTITAQSLSSEAISEIVNKLSKRFNKEIVLTSRVDESLIGGIRLLFNGQELDQSVRRQLDKMQHAVARKGS
jgi:F-type H+-transporting ATPase subunit delta